VLGTLTAGAGAMAALELVIFDCDGVLVDSERISNRVLAEMLSREGLPITPVQARRRYQGLMLGEVVEHAQGELGRALPDGWAERYEEERNEAFAAELHAVPHARGAVEAVLAAAVAVCVASQGRPAKTRLTLELSGLRDLFAEDALFSAEAVPRGKPHPDLFLHAAAAAGAAPGRTAVVEDSATGVRAGVAAGMRVLGYAADGDARALGEAGAEVIASMAELPARLGLG
jgi:HAD superfamily hydrolase (TIGR01509 family)